MITKDHLVSARERTNVVLLKLMHQYKKNENKLYLIVEGNDDYAYYKCVMARYPKNNYEILVASGKKNVLRTHSNLDWKEYSENHILFFVDRDLSDILQEPVPTAINVYVTDSYSIENYLFNEHTLFIALELFEGIRELSQDEKNYISKLYYEARIEHEKIFLQIMAWILYWLENGLNPSLNNLNDKKLYVIRQGILKLNQEYNNQSLFIKIHEICGVDFSCNDITLQIKKLKSYGSPDRFIRGKYIQAFFVEFVKSIALSAHEILSNRTVSRAVNSIHNKNVLTVLCGYMPTPDTLVTFLSKFCD